MEILKWFFRIIAAYIDAAVLENKSSSMTALYWLWFSLSKPPMKFARIIIRFIRTIGDC